MRRKVENKIKWLHKAHIWPSILFMLCSLGISVTSFTSYVTTTVEMLCTERLDAVCTSASGISSMFNDINENEKEIIENICKYSDFTDSIFILDENNDIIAGVGNLTYNPKPLIISITDTGLNPYFNDEKYTVYYDTSIKNNLLDPNGKIEINSIINFMDLKELFKTIRAILEMNNSSGSESKNKMFEARFWFENKLSNERTALVQCSVILSYYDFGRSFMMGVISSITMVFPILFLFINVLMGVSAQKRSTNLLYTDTVTSGKNLTYFEHESGKHLSLRQKPNKIFMVVDVTVMKYRSYCNYHGVRKGEELLENIDKLMSQYMKKGEFCAHSAKSSFALFMYCTDKESGKKRVDDMLKDMAEKFEKGGLNFHSGIYFHEKISKKQKKIFSDPVVCLNCASTARASLTDENITDSAVYNKKLLEKHLWEHKVEEKMHDALENEEFKVYIQPKYDPATEKLAGAEALIRWINDEDGFIPPGRFIPIFEKNGFITKIDDYMITHVSKLQSEWLAEGRDIVPISVNVSRAHFSDPDLAEHICSLVDKYNVPHKFIEIELTESAFFDDKEALLRTVHKLSELDFEISMDDFGAGYSSLNSLKDLPLNVLKLDAEFFRGEDSENRGEIVVSEAISLAKKLNMRIVAEGVEKKEQVDFLASQGCDMIQGFYFAKPMPAEEYAERLK